MLHRVVLLGALCAALIGKIALADDGAEDKPRGEFADKFSFDEYKVMRKKRVRRAVRDLNPSEWARITDAMNIMKFTNTEEGRAIYGPSYSSYDKLVCSHMRSILTPDGDRSHFGPWFFLWHASYVKRFEDILRLIDPQIKALPYVDWRPDGGLPFQSSLFSDKYFGELAGDQSDGNYAIQGSAFDHWPIANKATTHPSDLCEGGDLPPGSTYNPYGHLRIQSNFNPSPFVTRMGGFRCGNPQPCELNLELCLSVPSSILHFFECGDIFLHGFQHLCIAGTKPRTPGNPESPACLGPGSLRTIDPMTGATRHLTFAEMGCWDIPESCDPVDDGDWSGDDCIPVPTNQFCDLSAFGLPTYDMSPWLDPSSISWFGDMVDVPAGPNDPFFMFVHSNVDRMFSLWKLRNREFAPNYLYPGGLFMSLDRYLYPEEEFSTVWQDTLGRDGPYSMQDVLDATDFMNPDYTYDDILDAIHQEGE